MSRIIEALIANVFLAACLGAVVDAQALAGDRQRAVQRVELPGVEWHLRKMGDMAKEGEGMQLQMNLTFQDAVAHGSDGCNFIRVPYSLGESSALRFDTRRMVSTRMGCAGEARALSGRFYRLLAQVAHYRIEAQTLHLLGAEGTTLLLYETQGGGSGKQAHQATPAVRGKVVFPRAGQALPAGTTIRIVLADVSLADTGWRVLSEHTHAIGSTDSVEFSLPYRNEQLEGGERFVVAARVEREGKLLFINDTHHGVIRNGPVRGVVVRVAQVSGN